MRIMQSLDQSSFVAGYLRTVTLRAARLTQHATRPTFAHIQLPLHVFDRLTPTRRTYPFPR